MFKSNLKKLILFYFSILLFIYNQKMYTYIKEMNMIEKNYQIDLTNLTDEVIHPNDWIIYKTKGNEYKLCVDYLGVNSANCYYGLSSFDIKSSSDDIILLVTPIGNAICYVITDKYKYLFEQSNSNNIITNKINGSYKYTDIQLLSIEKILKNVDTEDKYHLELDKDILNFYIDGEYKWSKIISTRYTKGIYFVLEDKIFTVIDNGNRKLDILNLDGSLHKKIKTSMEYIETFEIIHKDNKPAILKLSGFVWQPIFMKQYIDIETLFMDKMKQVTYDEYNSGYKDHTFSEDEFTEPNQGNIDDSDDDNCDDSDNDD